MTDLYDRLGGPVAVEELVARLDQRLLLDPRTADLFDGVDLTALADHQHLVITALLGAAEDLHTHDLRRAHVGLGLEDEHFDAFLAHLVGVLAAMGTPRPVADEVMAAFAGLRAEILDL